MSSSCLHRQESAIFERAWRPVRFRSPHIRVARRLALPRGRATTTWSASSRAPWTAKNASRP